MQVPHNLYLYLLFIQMFVTIIKMAKVTNTMKNVVKGMDKIMTAMDPVAITKVMDDFDRVSDNAAVAEKAMDSAMTGVSALSTPADDVDALIAEVADANNLKISHEISVGKGDLQQQVQVDDLLAQFDKLKAKKIAN